MDAKMDMGWASALFSLLVLIQLALGISALVKYLSRSATGSGDDES